MNSNLIATLLALATIAISAWAIFKYVILLEIRIEPAIFKKIYNSSNLCWKIIFSEEIKIEIRSPSEYTALMKYTNYPYFYISHSERLLNAGWQGKDYVSRIICFRWQYQGVAQFLKKLCDNKIHVVPEIPVYLITPNYVDSIGKIKSSIYKPAQPKHVWADIENHVEQTLENQGSRFGVILHGPPGNGKTSFIKYLAEKYQLPIYYITFSPEYDNLQVMFVFAQIPPKSIVILEDFDSYFDKRQCVMQNNYGGMTSGARFTFDTIINSLDGVYTSFDRNIFILTSNNIDKIDDSLKYRPSRFKIVREFPNPEKDVIVNYIGPIWAKYISDINYDQLIRLAEFKQEGVKLTKALHILSLPIPVKVYNIAQRIYENKLKANINTNDTENFLQACGEFDNYINLDEENE